MASGIATQSGAPNRVFSANIRTGPQAHAITEALIENLHCLQAKLPQHATRNDWYMALAYTVRDRMMDRYISTIEAIVGTHSNAKVVGYLSAEFLTGPHLGNSLLNLGIWTSIEEALSARRSGLGEPAGARGGARAGKWGPRPLGGVLHGLPGDT